MQGGGLRVAPRARRGQGPLHTGVVSWRHWGYRPPGGVRGPVSPHPGGSGRPRGIHSTWCPGNPGRFIVSANKLRSATHGHQ